MGVVIFWGLGLGIVTVRWAKAGAPPTPGALAAASGLYALCGLLHAYPPARTTASLLAGGVTLAAYLQIVGGKPVKQQTGWPPLPINDPLVLLPAGVKNGQAVAEGSELVPGNGNGTSASGTGTGAPGTPTSGGKCPPGFPPGMICAG